MIKYVKGNIFEQQVQTFVNTVNCEGVMGKGYALEFKNKFPAMYESYRKVCTKKLLKPGLLLLFKEYGNLWILNFPTKTTWREKSKLSYIEEGLIKFVSTYKEKGIVSIVFPPLGCTNGGLDWNKEVKPLMEKYLSNLDIEILIIEG